MKLVDDTITYNSHTIKQLENLRKNGPGTLLSWSDAVRGYFGGKKDAMKRELHAELQLLTSCVQNSITEVTRKSMLQQACIKKLQDTYGDIAKVLLKDAWSPERFGDLKYWKKVLKSYTNGQLSFERMAAGFADTWGVIGDARDLVGDNVERLSKLTSSFEKLKAGVSTGILDDENAIGGYIALLKQVGKKLDEARTDARRVGRG